jgi:dephospho-CoA kinase
MAVFRVALTGGIATGKSHCLRRFAKLGVPVIDADRLSHEVLASGAPGFEAVAHRFGPAVVRGGAIDRDALGRIVFSDADARQALEAIVHPAVYGAIAAWFADLDAGGTADLAIADIPLLYETGHERDFDRVIVVACAPEHQLARVMARDELSEDDARRRIASQMPIEDKRRRADYVIETDDGVAQTDKAVEDVLRKLRAEVAEKRNGHR